MPAPFSYCILYQRLSAAPDVYCEEQEQPDNVNEVPVPSCRFKAYVFFLCEVAFLCADIANEQKDGSDHNVKAVKACNKEEKISE